MDCTMFPARRDVVRLDSHDNYHLHHQNMANLR